LDSGTQYIWKARVSLGVATAPATAAIATAYARNHAFNIGTQASFKETDAQPSAIDYLLGAVGADLLHGFQGGALRRGLVIYGLEANVAGYLNNPLTLLGVVGEQGHPGFEAISCTLYVSVEAEEQVLQEIWQETLRRSPLVNTLKNSVQLKLEMRLSL
jgi:hypothetical protein